MDIGLVLILITLIICSSFLFGLYMNFCNENEIGLFTNPKYGERIKELEKRLKELENK